MVPSFLITELPAWENRLGLPHSGQLPMLALEAGPPLPARSTSEKEVG